MIMRDAKLDDRNRAIARSAAYGLIAHGFRYPDPDWLAAFSDTARWRDWPDWLACAGDDLRKALDAIQLLVAGWNDEQSISLLQSEYAAIFGHSVRGACPPYELEYGRGEIIQRASDLADISGFYAAFGMEFGGDINERPDHLGVEAEFMAVLCAKEAHGVEQDIPELVEAVRNAQRDFVEAHLARWLPAFSRRVQDAKLSDFYARLADFATCFLHAECRHLGVSLGSSYLELRPADPVAESTQSCGVPSECAQPPGDRFTPLNVAVGKNG